MDFGKVQNLAGLDKINLSLPSLEARSVQLLQKFRLNNKAKVWVGCPIWGKKEWVGKVYPIKTSPKDFLELYSRQFNTVELNTSFYRIPDPQTIDTWTKSVPSGFRFCPKFFQGISHQIDLKTSDELFRSFCHAILEFKENLGTSFLQLPPHFDRSKLPVLERWIGLLPKEIELAIEFRHMSWFDQNTLRQPIYHLLAQNRVATVITDVAGRRDVLHGSLSSSTAFVRFVGNGLHPSDYARIDEWVIRLNEWIHSGLQKLYFFIHQPDDAVAPDLVSYFINRLNEYAGTGVKNWEPVETQQQFDLFG